MSYETINDARRERNAERRGADRATKTLNKMIAAKDAEITKLTAWVKAAKGSLDERTLTGINARSHLEYAIAKKALEAGQ